MYLVSLVEFMYHVPLVEFMYLVPLVEFMYLVLHACQATQVFVVVLVLRISTANQLPCLLILYYPRVFSSSRWSICST